MPYFYEKNTEIHLTNSIDELIYYSFPIDVQSPEKNAHYHAVANIIFTSQYKMSLLTTKKDILLGQDFIDFITHHKLTSSNKYHGIDLLYLLSLSHDTALRAGIWRLGSPPHLKATEIISSLSKLDAIERLPLMKESLEAWKKLFLKAKFELQQQAAGTCPDSTRNMLGQMTLYAFTDNNKNNERQRESQSDQTRLEVDREQFRLLEEAYYKEKKREHQTTEIQSYYSDEEEEYNVTQQQYYYN